MKGKLPIKAIITFAVLLIAGVILIATADKYIAGYGLVVLGNIGTAIIGGSLAFFLIEMFRWDREQNKGK